MALEITATLGGMDKKIVWDDATFQCDEPLDLLLNGMIEGGTMPYVLIASLRRLGIPFKVTSGSILPPGIHGELVPGAEQVEYEQLKKDAYQNS